MSQLNGKLDWSFDKGWSWIAVINVTPTGQMRRKVIAEMGSRIGGSPQLLIQLDILDRLSCVITDRTGAQFSTIPIPPEKFALRTTWIMVQIICDPFDPATTLRTLRVTISVQGQVLTGELVATGDFGGPVEEGAHSVGASLQETDPATFRLAELVTIGRAPLTPQEIENLEAYFHQKHQMGGADG
ncbi:hypothetical protein [Aquamicrobium soli]|uniref:Uncharacterized protein n=1 Tax=Aquamicrobium soli TaxID=1811518 RepID=A0ABV7KIT6_9HYPH